MTLLVSGLKYTICSHREASKYLLEVLESVSETDLNDVIERILDAVEKQPCKDKTASNPLLLMSLLQSVELLSCISLIISSFLSVL